jgi:hypothetical protein
VKLLIRLVFIAAPFVLGCTRSDECRNSETITVQNPVTGKSETYPAALCTGTVVCDDRVRQIPPLKAAWIGHAGPCHRKYLNQFESGYLPSNCRDLKLTATPICLEGSDNGGPSTPPVIVGATVGATSGGDWPLVEKEGDSHEGEGGSW